MPKDHHYNLNLTWTGNTGSGTAAYKSYERAHMLSATGKPDLLGSSDPAFRGDASKWNPEELLLGSLAACHMLWYLHFCSDNKIIVETYTDSPEGSLSLQPSGIGQFTQAILRPNVKITDPNQIELARSLHEKAHQFCFIAKSVNFPVQIEPVVSTG